MLRRMITNRKISYFRAERIGARALSAHLRKLCDYLTYEFANLGQNQNINKRADAINDFIWKYNLVIHWIALFYAW